MTGTDFPGFTGFPADGLAFLAELERDNTRAFWTGNVHRYRVALLEPTRALAAALTAEFGEPRVFRPYVDRRFRPNADPYRTDTGLTVTGPGGTPYAVVLSTRGLAVQVGYQTFDPEQLRKYRTAVDGAPGEGLAAVLATVLADGLAPDEVASLSGRPRGCPRDHPRLSLMRLRGLHVDRSWSPGGWLDTDEPLELVRAAWRAARPLADWLDAHVGPRPDPIRARAPLDGSDQPAAGATSDHGAAHSASP
jgi:uncharacterized protein (DUF2461 family)